MGKIYLIIYLIIFLGIVISLIVLANQALKLLPKLNNIAATTNNMQNNINEINKKIEYINSVKNRVFSPKLMSMLAKVYLANEVISDLNNSKKKSLVKSFKKAMK